MRLLVNHGYSYICSRVTESQLYVYGYTYFVHTNLAGDKAAIPGSVDRVGH